MKVENLNKSSYDVIRYSEPWRSKTYVSMTGKSKEEWRCEFVSQLLSTGKFREYEDVRRVVSFVDELMSELETTSDFRENSK